MEIFLEMADPCLDTEPLELTLISFNGKGYSVSVCLGLLKTVLEEALLVFLCWAANIEEFFSIKIRMFSAYEFMFACLSLSLYELLFRGEVNIWGVWDCLNNLFFEGQSFIFLISVLLVWFTVPLKLSSALFVW